MHGGIGLDAHVHVLKGRLGLSDVVGVVSDNQGNVQFPPHRDQSLIQFGKIRHVLVALQFQEISVAEQLLVPASDPVSFRQVSVVDQPGHFGRRAAGDSDEAAVVLFQQLAVDAGTVVETINVGPSDQLHQVAITCIVPCQQEQVVGAALVGALVEAAAFGDVDLAPDNWLDVRLFAGLVEFHHTVHGAVVGDR